MVSIELTQLNSALPTVVLFGKSWKNADNDLGTSEATSYAIDVQGGKVFVAGTTDNMDLLLVYDASNGDLNICFAS